MGLAFGRVTIWAKEELVSCHVLREDLLDRTSLIGALLRRQIVTRPNAKPIFLICVICEICG